MSEPQARSRTDNPRHGMGKSRQLRGPGKPTAEATWMLHQTEFEKKMHQSINTILTWYDRLSRYPGMDTAAADVQSPQPRPGGLTGGHRI